MDLFPEVSPDHVDWSVHFPKFFPESGMESDALLLNTSEYPIQTLACKAFASEPLYILQRSSKHTILRFGPTFFAIMVLTLFFVVSPQVAAQLCQSAQSLQTQSIGPAQENGSWLGFPGFLSKQQRVTEVMSKILSLKPMKRPETHSWI